MWQMIPLAVYYELQITVNIVYTSKFNLNIYFLWIQRKYVQFHNMKFKMPKSQLLIGLETSFKNWQKAQNVNIYVPSKVYIWSYPIPPLVYGLNTCENVDNYGWPLTYLQSHTYITYVVHLNTPYT